MGNPFPGTRGLGVMGRASSIGGNNRRQSVTERKKRSIDERDQRRKQKEGGVAREVVGIKYSDDLYGVRATINVYEPKVKKDSKDLSQSGVLIYNGPRDQKEGAGACYSIALSFNGDSFARFHVTWRDAKLHKPGYDHTCPGFVQVSHRVDLGGRVLLFLSIMDHNM
ncbi:hypothetical protein ZWY2020_013661 [Hordeum vulgare]|nr:hypothetical protein ZWY2020_013661 [Hordeum vulgare]